jgi:hypothetical protein
MRSSPRQFLALILLLGLSLEPTIAYADPPVPDELNDRITIEACVLTSEKPHLSGHVPGTVNVSGRTTCKGISKTRVLSVAVTLTRSINGKNFSISKSAKGVGSVVVYVSMPCIWKSGNPIIKYTITTIHKLSNGKSELTGSKAELKC